MLTRSVREHPIFIWTLRRTGGTNFAQALFRASSYVGVEHEPFNPARAFGYVARDWRRTKNRANLTKSLEGILGRKFLIKHCLELFDQDFNDELVNIASANGYFHVILYRRDEFQRLLSLHYAQHYKWNTKLSRAREGLAEIPAALPIARLVRHAKSCSAKLASIKELLRQREQPFRIINYERLYGAGPPEAGQEFVLELARDIGMVLDEIATASLLASIKRRGGSQSDYERLPGYSDLRDALSSVDLFRELDPEPGTLRE